MKVVIDTNVIVSGIFFGGIPGEILKSLRRGFFKLVLSHEIYEEYLEVVKELQIKYPLVNGIEIVKTILLISVMTYSVGYTMHFY